MPMFAAFVGRKWSSDVPLTKLSKKFHCQNLENKEASFLATTKKGNSR
jgi:hypothetical protein